jgi:hypothetical protein
MSRFNSGHPLTKPFLLFGFGLVLVIMFFLWGQTRKAQTSNELDMLERRIQFSQAGPVSPSAAALASLLDAIQGLTEANAKLDAALFSADAPDIIDFPGNSTAAYFELASFIEEMARGFVGAGVLLPENPRFGFSQFEQQGPEPEILNAVMRQKSAASILLELLSKARPIAFVSIQRELLVLEGGEKSLLQQAAAPRQSARKEYADVLIGDKEMASFESFTFELVFEGYTESLRQYLKSLLSAPIPIVVTGLKVQPLDRFESTDEFDAKSTSSNPFDLLANGEDPETEDGPIPIIRNNLSAFSLRVEVFTGKEKSPGV